MDSDRTCPECQAGLEQFCPGMTLTFNSPDKHLGGFTYVQARRRAGAVPLVQRDRDQQFHSLFVTSPGSPIQGPNGPMQVPAGMVGAQWRYSLSS